MLAKVITRTHGSRARGFDRVFKYILRADGKANPCENRPRESGSINLADEPYWVASEHPIAYAEDLALIFDSSVRQCQRRGRFRGNPIYHVAITWKEGEHPTALQAERSCQHVMKALGFEQCQALWALHRDTDNEHLHLVVNRVHPEKFTAASVPRRDYLILDRAMRELELELGFARSNGPYVTVDTPEGPKIVRMSRSERSARGLLQDPEAPRVTNGAERAEYNSGGTSFQRWITGAPAAALREVIERDGAQWQEVHEVLAQFGCLIAPKGSGLVVTTTLSGDRVLAAKASTLGRFASKALLERRLGPFMPPGQKASVHLGSTEETYQRFLERERLDVARDGPGSNDPGRIARRAERSEARRRLVERFTLEQTQNRAERVRERGALRERQADERNALFIRHRNERRASRAPRASRQPFALSLWAFRAAKEREALQRRHAEERRALTGKLAPSEVWRFWLERQAERGDEAAESALRGIRYRERRRQRVQDGFRGEAGGEPGPFAVSALRAEIDAKHQIVVYRRADGVEVFRDQGLKIVMRDKASESLEAALRVASQKYAGRVEIMGSQEFRERATRMATRLKITVLDADLQGVVADERRHEWDRWGRFHEGEVRSPSEERRPNKPRSPGLER